MFNKKKKDDEAPMNENREHVENTMTNEDIQPEAAQEEPAAEEKLQEQTEPTAEETLKKENSELNDKYLRLFAEFDNYKRRTQKERIELLQTASKDVVVSLLPILDDFERALKATENATDVVAVREGVVLIQNKLNGILTQKGLKEIESLDKEFDTDLHEAITQIPAPTEAQKGKVVDEVQKGYTLNGNVIRYAKVVVGA